MLTTLAMTMRQAIEEGFIEDVLKNYVTYKTYYKLLKACEDDPNVERKKAARALSRYMRLHPHNISQKTEVMIEHFQNFSRHKIGGRAKAMVVTGSRLEAVRYKQSFDTYIAKKGYRKSGPGYQFDDEVKLEYYRLQKISEGSISLNEGVAMPLDGPKEVGSGMVHEEDVPLSRLIDLINERFGEDLNEADQLFFDQITEAATQVDAIRQAVKNNPIEKFKLVFGEILESLFIERMDINENLFARYMNDQEFKNIAAEWLGDQVYSKIPKSLSYVKAKKPKAGTRDRALKS